MVQTIIFTADELKKEVLWPGGTMHIAVDGADPENELSLEYRIKGTDDHCAWHPFCGEGPILVGNTQGTTASMPTSRSNFQLRLCSTGPATVIVGQIPA